MKRVRILHPQLLAISPILFLFSHNIHELSIWTSRTLVRLVLPASISLCATWLLSKGCDRVFKNPHKSGIMTSLVMLTCFSYGMFSYAYTSTIVRYLHREALFEIAAFILGPNKLYLMLCGLVVTTGAYLLRRWQADATGLTRFLNGVASMLILLSLGNILVYGAKRLSVQDDFFPGQTANFSPRVLRPGETLPDVYYIILDAYASASTLQELYSYGNQEFLADLTQKGFYIASQSCSNYAFTTLSLPSSLNMEYLNSLGKSIGLESKDLTVPIQLLRDNKVIHFLQSQGYVFIHFMTPFIGTDYNQYADVEIDCDGRFIRDRFLIMLIQTSFLGALARFSPQEERSESLVKHQRIQCQFSKLAQLSDEFETPLFVFAHITAPHFPYVFGPNGEFISEQAQKTTDPKTLYLNQLLFINAKVKELLAHLLAHSETNPPIIILQADHGPWNVGEWEGDDLYKNRMRILNAYYLPGGGEALLYPAITPVNTFRIIFNQYFGTAYDLLDDQCYYSWYERPYQFLDVTGRLWTASDQNE